MTTPPAGATSPRRGPGVDLVDVGLGVSGLAWSVLSTVGRPLARVAGSDRGAQLLHPLAERGRGLRSAALAGADNLLATVLPATVDALATRIDLTQLVHDHVDLDRLAATLDLDLLAATLDVDAVAHRLDLIGLANEVIDGVDLPGIIRQSSASVTSEAVRDVRMQGIEADQAISRVLEHLLPRRHHRESLAPGPDGAP